MSEHEVVICSDIPGHFYIDLSDPEAVQRFFEERLPKIVRDIVPKDATRSAPIRVHELFPVGQRKKRRVLQKDVSISFILSIPEFRILVDDFATTQKPYSWMPNRLLPVYMDPFLIAAPAESLPRAVYGFTLVDKLLRDYTMKEDLGYIPSYESGRKVYSAAHAQGRALRHLSKKFGVNLQVVDCHHTPGRLVLALACNHELAAVPEGIKEKAWELLRLLRYPDTHEPL